MKKLMFLLLAAVSCQMLSIQPQSDGQGELRIAFYDDPTRSSVDPTRSSVDPTRSSVDPTRSYDAMPDTSDFLLTITGPDGEIIYDGVYGDSPESVMVDAGSYTVYVRSCDFTRPAFSTPQYGDEQCVVVPAGGVADVKLLCTQMNAGVRLRIDESFLTECPDASLFLKSAQGKLMYSYSEKRVAFFLPGSVSLMMSEGGTDKVLMTRNLQAQTVLNINVSAASASTGDKSQERISVAVDTTRTWLTEDYIIGGGADKGDDISDALTVSQALASIGEEDVWVCGYIVGGDLSSSSASFDGPFSSRTNILLGGRSSTSSRESCLSVNLPSGKIREALNLVDNPSVLGRKVSIKGDIVEAYYGMPGIRNVVDYKLH